MGHYFVGLREELKLEERKQVQAECRPIECLVHKVQVRIIIGPSFDSTWTGGASPPWKRLFAGASCDLDA